MRIGKVREAMTELAALFGAAGAKAQNKELAALSKSLEGHEDKSIAEFFLELQWRATNVSSRKKSSGKKSDSLPDVFLHQERVDQYVEKLDKAGTNDNDFRVVLSEVRLDKLIRKREADAIASAYAKVRRAWKTKREAFDAIESTFRQRGYQAVKMKQVDKASRF